MGKKEDVLIVLDNLLKLEDVQATMLARKDLGGVVPERQKIKDAKFWNIVKDSTSQIFLIIERFFVYHVERINFELGEYLIAFVPINRTYSLIVIVDALANMGLVDVEIENSKRKISLILDNKGS